MSNGPRCLIKPGTHLVFRTALLPGLAVFVLMSLLSCSTKSLVRLKAFTRVTETGNFLETAEKIKKKPSLYGKSSLFLYHMDLGMLYHYASAFDSSLVYLQKASDIHDALFTRSVSNETASLLVNDNVRPYRSKPYELVLLHQICALNYMALDKPDEALVEARKTQLLFNEWERKSKGGNGYASDPMFHYVSSIVYDGQGAVDDAMISLYQSIVAFEKGPVPLPPELAVDAYYRFKKNDRDEDADKLRIKIGNPEGATDGPANGQSEIVVVCYSGKGPAMAEEVWWGDWIKDGLLVLHHSGKEGKSQTLALPAPAIPVGQGKGQSASTVFIKVALPRVETYGSRTAYFKVQQGMGAPIKTETLNNYDRQAEKQWEDDKTPVITRTVIRTLIRTITAQEVKQQTATQSPITNLFLSLGTDALMSQLEKADTRTCFFIPKTVQIARLPLSPGTYSLTVTAYDRQGQAIASRPFDPIVLKSHQKKFLFYHSFH